MVKESSVSCMEVALVKTCTALVAFEKGESNNQYCTSRVHFFFSTGKKRNQIHKKAMSLKTITSTAGLIFFQLRNPLKLVRCICKEGGSDSQKCICN